VTSKEIVRRVARRQDPPRLGWDFLDNRYCDIQYTSPIHLINEAAEPYAEFGDYEALKKRANFHGEVCMDAYGNIYGRLNGRTKGECVMGALEKSWAALADYRFPEFDMKRIEKVRAQNLSACEQYVITGMPMAVFSTLRDLRKMDNALMDTVEEPEMIKAYMVEFTAYMLKAVHVAADCGVDAVILYDDWGMQFSPFISPALFRAMFKPVYRALTDACHERNIDFILHSCGFVLPLVDDMIDAGIDVFQFDQPEAAGSRLWAEQYSDRVSFYCPVDIQRVMPTGDRALIEKTARDMACLFRDHGGALIAKDYPSWHDIDVKDEWARWAMDVIVENSYR
jgi:uroporphyrinogen decarboxylase